MGYFDLDDVLKEEERVPCTFRTEIIKLGHLDSSQVDQVDLKKGAVVDVPLWLARLLNSRGYVNVATPKVFGATYRHALQADASVVNLYGWCPYYYDFGLEFAKMSKLQDLPATLIQAFARRYRSIMDISQNAIGEDTSGLTQKLDMMERKLFRAGHHADKEFQSWLQRKSHKLTTAYSQNKRRRVTTSS